MTHRFRKKPVVIDAHQWDGDRNALWRFIGHTPERPMMVNGDYVAIDTLEGTMRANLGDWIIKGVKGEFYPCKPDIFEQTYEPVLD
jgi:hypothetical protein